MIVCRSAAELDRMRAANQLVASVLVALEAAVAPGVTTEDLDRLAERLVRAGGGEPAFKGYRGFPATLCASINDEEIELVSDGDDPANHDRAVVRSAQTRHELLVDLDDSDR